MANIITNIFLVGFHHKRGSEVEFAYPSSSCWKDLLSVAMPDGAHKCVSDCIYFMMPVDEDNGRRRVAFGVACFRQTAAENIKNKPDDVTRNSIQKSIVILSVKPLFGAIGSLLSGITENFFAMGDFSRTDLIVESFHQMNEHFRIVIEHCQLGASESMSTDLVNQGLSATDLLLRYEHDLFALIKLMLLCRRVVFFMEPVSKLTTTVLTLVSLIEGVLFGNSIHETLNLIDEDVASHTVVVPLGSDTCSHSSDESSSVIDAVTTDKPAQAGSVLSNLRSGGSHAIKALTGLTGVDRGWWSRQPASDQEVTIKPPRLADDLTVPPVPPFLDKSGAVPDTDKFRCVDATDLWGFPLSLFDEENVLLPYATLSELRVLDNGKIKSFMVGANNCLWKMKGDKMDAIIAEDNRNGSIQFTNKSQQAVLDEIPLWRLVQLTTIDRRLAEYLLKVTRRANQPSVLHGSCSSPNLTLKVSNLSNSNPDLMIEAEEDVIASGHHQQTVHDFVDQKSLEDWLRSVITDYIKALLLSAAGWGTRASFDDFGTDFMLAVQKQKYFKSWYYSVVRDYIVEESTSSMRQLLMDSTLTLNVPVTGSEDGSYASQKKVVLMNFEHPGRFLVPRMGDNLPGYYQFKEYAGHSKAIVNRGVKEIRRIGNERGGQIKSSVSAGISKLSGIAKMQGAKLTAAIWQPDGKQSSRNHHRIVNDEK